MSISFNRNDIIKLLNQDSYYRKEERWPLLTSNSFVNIDKIEVSFNEIFCCYHRKNKEYHERSFGLDKIKTKINADHPFTQELLFKFKGYLVACGGALVSSYISYHDLFWGQDIDFFFYDVDIIKANQIRIDFITFIADLWKGLIGKKKLKSKYRIEIAENSVLTDVNIFVERNEYVTTIHVKE